MCSTIQLVFRNDARVWVVSPDGNVDLPCVSRMIADDIAKHLLHV